MLQLFNNYRIMEAETISKNGASPKIQMSRLFFILFIFLLPYICSFGQYEKYNDSYKRGMSLFDQGNYDEALKIFTQGTKQQAPNNVNLNWFGLARTYNRFKKYDDALEYYNKFLDQAAHPTGRCAATTNYNGIEYCLTKYLFGSVHNNIGEIYESKGNIEAAFFNYNIAISVGSVTSYRLTNRARIYRKQGKFQEAINDYKQVIKDKDYAKEQKDSLTNIIIELYDSIDNYAEFYEFLKQVPNKTAEQYDKLAFTSFQLEKFEEVVRYYDEALKLQPSLSINTEAHEASKKYVAELREKERQEREERNRLNEIQKKEAEVRRVADLKKAQVGDKLLYSETWHWEEGWIFIDRGAYTMMVTCFIERIEGDRYQLRVGDVSSDDNRRSTTPTINGVRVNKGDLIWARPLNGNQWVYGESW